MRGLRFLAAVVALAAAAGAEWASWEGDATSTAFDAAAGLVLISGGAAVAAKGARAWRVGLLLSLAGGTWFLGNLAGWALLAHRGPLTHALLAYPRGRVPRLLVPLVAASYVDGLVEPLGRSDAVTAVLAGAVLASAAARWTRARGPERRGVAVALAAAAGVAAVLAAGSTLGLAGEAPGVAFQRAYALAVATAAVLLAGGLVLGRWTEAVLTGLVVDLGRRPELPLQQRLADTLGDPSLVVGYRLPDGRLVDEAGRAVVERAGASTTTVEGAGILVHDSGAAGDDALVESVAAAARMALANAALEAEVHSQIAELERSRRRLVEAADEQRRELERELRRGTQARLEHVAGLVAGVDAELEREVEATLAELRELARGLHPTVLAEGGLDAALRELARRSPVPVSVRGTAGRLPAPVEAAAYFVCSEALANVAKHARASAAVIDVACASGRLEIRVADDGVGGAKPAGGSGLRGLSDRVEALGGSLRVVSVPAGGTTVWLSIPGA